MAVVNPIYVKSHKGVFIGAAAAIALALILTFANLKYLLHPVVHILVILIASVALLYLAYVLARRDDTAPATDTSGPKWGILIAAIILYLIIAIAPLTSSRTNRVENCTPKHTLTVDNNENAKEWVDYYRTCPGSKYIIDNLTEEYVIENHEIPSWLMDKQGITSDPNGWWNYYSKNPNNPYKLEKVTPAERRNFLEGNRQLPAHTLNGD